MKKAFLFPGQGSQKVGMVHDLYTRYDAVKKLILGKRMNDWAFPSLNLCLKVRMMN